MKRKFWKCALYRWGNLNDIFREEVLFIDPTNVVALSEVHCLALDHEQFTILPEEQIPCVEIQINSGLLYTVKGTLQNFYTEVEL